jgi:hypothetical protein
VCDVVSVAHVTACVNFCDRVRDDNNNNNNKEKRARHSDTHLHSKPNVKGALATNAVNHNDRRDNAAHVSECEQKQQRVREFGVVGVQHALKKRRACRLQGQCRCVESVRAAGLSN